MHVMVLKAVKYYKQVSHSKKCYVGLAMIWLS